MNIVYQFTVSHRVERLQDSYKARGLNIQHMIYI